jgi:hypothetical protein
METGMNTGVPHRLSPILTDAARSHPHFLRITTPSGHKHKNPFQMGNETPCCNLIHLSNSFPFFHQFLFPRIECTSVATRSERGRVRQDTRAILRPAHPLHTMDGS